MEEYELSLVTTETWTARCIYCKKPFRSDVKNKAIKKVLDHLQNCPEKGK